MSLQILSFKLREDNVVQPIAMNGWETHGGLHVERRRSPASASPVPRGEYPSPPQLASDGVEDDPQGWTFWKIENGIR